MVYYDESIKWIATTKSSDRFCPKRMNGSGRERERAGKPFLLSTYSVLKNDG